MSVLVQATDLEAGYRFPVVGPLSFSVSEGEVVGVWGANGAGKSTLLNAIGGSARVFAGELRRAPGLRVGYQEQQPVRLPEMPMTGRELLHYAGAGTAPVPLRLRPWLSQRIDRLSGGQFQLLSTWAVLAASADLVILDEPTNNLDPAGEKILAEILRAETGRRAVLVVSHERSFLDASCTRLIGID